MNAPTRPLRELPVAAFLVAFGSLVVAGARHIPSGVPTDPLGPRAFPMALGAGIACCGALLAAATALFRGQTARPGILADADPDDEAAPGPFSPGRLIAAVGATLGYLAAFEPLGYLITTPLYVVAILLVHGGAARRSLWLAPLLITAALYAVFRFGLLIPVPVGLLERLL
ncbi:MAG: tripartite tricarboxylate transporter TctB family protein [Armatimonadota bacterium]|nr:tripartite tricarboxylate transporter TctB family protein [Armatimonadota bacterium]